MMTYSNLRAIPTGHRRLMWLRVIFTAVLAAALGASAAAGQDQEDPLNKVHVAPPPAATPATGAPVGVEKPAETGKGALRVRPGEMIRMNVDMVLIPVTVTDPMNRLVTGLEQEDFQIFENNGAQPIRSFACEDAP